MKGRSLVPACALVLVVSCGGGKQEPAQAPAQTGQEPQAVVLPPLAKVAPPAELFAIARVPNAAKSADTGVAWSGLPVNWRSLLDKAVPGLSQTAVFDAPLDFAAMLDPTSVEEPRVQWAFSVGVSSTDTAAAFFRSQGGQVTQEAAGAYRAKVGDGLTCDIVRALGAAPARVVCSDGAASADALAPYMSCGMPTESFGPSEIHAHVTAEPFRRRYGSQVTLVRTVGIPFLLRELSLDAPKFDRALRDVLYGLADEVIALSYDLDRLDFDAVLATGGNALDVSTSLSMAGQRSWWAQTATRAAGKGTPAPDAFWKLPADALAASYSAPSDPERFRAIAASLRELADGWLDYHKLPEKRRTPLVEAFEQMMTTTASGANAGLLDEAAQPADHGMLASPEAVRVALGQHLFVFDQGGDREMRFASELMKSLGDPALRKHLAQTNVLAAAEIPTGKERAPKFAKGLDPKTKVYELTIPAAALESARRMTRPGHGKDRAPAPPPVKGAKPAEPIQIFLVAMPDGPLTWFGFGTDEKLLEERLADVKAGKSTLATREGLATLKTESANSAGFSSLASLAEGLRSSLGDVTTPNAKNLNALPHRGENPLLWHASADANGPKMVATARVPRELVEDLIALAATSAASALHR
ncbi:MAG TPA: hypothetical protein VH062_34510 [Polyangiaceae bacterium]|jgi:hypothetical protein|nr:hypothetical protein [Polyangiaceae bacterium]